jgi:DsbC/DsbD-like thiol-disulfide interchange protein
MFSLIAMAIVGQMPAEPALAVTLPSKARPGQIVKGTATLIFASGLHAYQNPPAGEYEIPVKLTVGDKSFVLVKVSYPKGKELTMPGESKPSKVYEGKTAIPFQLKASAKPGVYKLPIRVEYQQCNASSCFPPSSIETKVSLTVKV